MLIDPQVPVFCGLQDVDNVRRQVDREIRYLEDAVCKLKTHRNTLAPISRLPTELLYKIFTTFACFEQSDYSCGADISWIRPITAVCSHWRAVALECPRLWSSIIFSRPSWAAEMLKRSKNAPLIIKADLTYLTPKMVDAVHMALQHVSRIRELHITASKATMEKLIDNLNQRAPQLQSLCLSNPRYSHFLMDDGYTLPDSLFDGDGHRLRRLELVKCNIRWDSPLLSGLTQIKIHKTSNMSRPTITQLLEALEKMPSLEMLDMEDSLPVLPEGDTVPPTERVVNLSHLSSLRLVSTALECSFLLNHISYPATTSLKLRCIPNVTTDRDFSVLFNAISHVGSGEGCKPLRSLIVQSFSPKSIRLQGWTTSGCTDECAPSSQIDIELNWCNYSEESSERVMIDICKMLSITKLRTLSVFHLTQVSKNSWLSAFSNLTLLRTIHVRGPPAFGLALALATEAEAKIIDENLPGSKQPMGVFLPGLRKLLIEDTDFDDELRAENFFEDLRDCLMNRFERKAEVRELHLVECSGISELEVALLQELVVDVVWDGIEQSLDEEEEEEESDSYGSVGWGFPYYGPEPDEADPDGLFGYPF